MARSTNQRLWDQWRQRMERQRVSGLSIVEFCRREQVSSHTFHVWKRKFRQAISAGPRPDKATRARRSAKRQIVSPPQRPAHRKPARSAMATDSPGFLQLPVTAVRPSPWIELALPDGTILRLPQRNLGALVTVLRMLRGEQVELSAGEDGRA